MGRETEGRRGEGVERRRGSRVWKGGRERGNGRRERGVGEGEGEWEEEGEGV